MAKKRTTKSKAKQIKSRKCEWCGKRFKPTKKGQNMHPLCRRHYNNELYR